MRRLTLTTLLPIVVVLMVWILDKNLTGWNLPEGLLVFSVISGIYVAHILLKDLV